MPLGQKSLFIPGCVQGATILSVSVSACVTCVVFTDCESCTRPISTNSGSGSRRAWANAWDVFHHIPSRGGRGRPAAAAFVVCFQWGGFFRVFHEFAFSNLYTQSSQRRLGEGDPTASQSVHRELVPTYPHQMYRLLCSHLRNMASSVDQ